MQQRKRDREAHILLVVEEGDPLLLGGRLVGGGGEGGGRGLGVPTLGPGGADHTLRNQIPEILIMVLFYLQVELHFTNPSLRHHILSSISSSTLPCILLHYTLFTGKDWGAVCYCCLIFLGLPYSSYGATLIFPFSI